MTLEQIARKFTLSDADAEKAISEAQKSAGAPLSLEAEKRAVKEAARNKKLLTPDECAEFKAVDDADFKPIRDRINIAPGITAPKDAILDNILSDYVQTAIEDNLESPDESPAQKFQIILAGLSSPRALRSLGNTIQRVNTELSKNAPKETPVEQPIQAQEVPQQETPPETQVQEETPKQPEVVPAAESKPETTETKPKKPATKKTTGDKKQLKAALDAQAQQLKTAFENEKAKLIDEFNQQKQQIIDGYKQELDAIKKQSANVEDTKAAESKALSDAQAELQSLKTSYGKQISDLQNTHSAQIQDLQNQLGSANSQNQSLQERIAELQQENQALKQKPEEPEVAAPPAAGNGDDDDLPLRRVHHVQERRETAPGNTGATGNTGTVEHQETVDAGGNDNTRAEYTKPERMGVDTTAMDEWNQAVVTKFGFPFINFACRDIANLLNGDDVARKRAYANIKDQLRQLAHLQTRGILGGMWDSMMESPIMLLKTLKSSSYSKCYLNTLIANGREVRDTPDGANLTVRPTIYGDVKFRVRKPEEIPISFINKFFVEVDPYRQLGMYRKWTGNPNGTTPEAYLDDNAIPYTSVLAPTAKTSFSRSDLSTGSFLSRVTGFRKANSMVTCSIDGHRGGFIIPTHLADVLFAY